MKFLLVTLISLFSLKNSQAQAGDPINVSTAAVASFKSSFANAAEVAWKVTDKFAKADFTLNGQYVSAFYDAAGNLMAVTRNINSFGLPLMLQKKLKTSYENFWISELFELTDESGTTYYATMEDGDEKITLKSFGTTEWSVYRKQSKS